ncbi:MAG: phosphoribosyltransferase [Cyanobacteria bacterium J06635_10]
MYNDVFVQRPRYELDVKRFYLDEYQPYWRRGEKNPNFTKSSFSSKILDLKEKKYSAINYFYKEVNQIIWKNYPIVTVPSSDPQNINTGINQVALLLAKQGSINAISCLRRHTAVQKKTNGGNRDIYVDLRSIEVNNQYLIKGRIVLLLDDITTTGNSFRACEKLLVDAGASKVVKLALGKTVRY